MMTGVYAEKSTSNPTIRAKYKVRFTGYAFGTILLCVCFKGILESATRQELDTEINSLISQSRREIDQDIQVINAITSALAPPLSLTVATVGGSRGTTVDVPVYFKSGLNNVSGLQFDVSNSSSVQVTGVQAGIAALAAVKTVQGNSVGSPTTGTFRVIIFGLNTNSISSGPVAVLKATVAQGATVGKKIIPLSGPAASSPSGTSVVVTGKGGSLSVK